MEPKQIIIAVILFLLGFALLIKGGDWFVDGAARIAKRLKIPELIVGATVVSIGTTLPEVMVSTGAAISGSSSTAYGNAMGSIICNVALISAITIAVKPSNIERKQLILPVIFFFAAAIFYTVISYTMGSFKRWTGIVLLAMFVIYMAVLIVTTIKAPSLLAQPEEEPEEEEKPNTNHTKWQLFKQTVWMDIILLIIGAAAIALGAKFLVDNCTILAKAIGVPETVIALTLVALGTSLPELITAITSLVKGHSALSLGNVIGANLFNLVLVSGMAITIAPFDIPAEKQIMGMNASFIVDIPLMLSVMLLLTLPALIKKKVVRAQGIILLAVYVAYCIFQFAL